MNENEVKEVNEVKEEIPSGVNQLKVDKLEGTIGRMLDHVKKRIPVKLSPYEAVLLLELVGFALGEMRKHVEESLGLERQND